MSLQIPDYIIDERFIRALQRNVISYLVSYFYNNPKNIYQFYYHISSTKDTGMFETLFFAPTKYVLTPLGFAVLYNNVKSLEYLLSIGSNPNTPGVVIDCPVEDVKLRWKIDLFRLHEVYPVCLTTPDSTIFSRLVEFGLRMGTEYKLRFRLITMEETKERPETCRGLWELAWIFWVKMKDPIRLLNVTDLLLVHGMSATQIMERVNLVPMMKKIFKTPVGNMPIRDEAIFITDLMRILLWSGCNFDETKLVDFIVPCVEIFLVDTTIIYSVQPEIVLRYKVLQGIANISKTFRKCLTNHNPKNSNLPLLNNSRYNSLEVQCVSVIRNCLNGILFNKKLSALNIDVTLKEVIQTCIPSSQKNQFVVQDVNASMKRKLSLISDLSKNLSKSENVSKSATSGAESSKLSSQLAEDELTPNKSITFI